MIMIISLRIFVLYIACSPKIYVLHTYEIMTGLYQTGELFIVIGKVMIICTVYKRFFLSIKTIGHWLAYVDKNRSLKLLLSLSNIHIVTYVFEKQIRKKSYWNCNPNTPTMFYYNERD